MYCSNFVSDFICESYYDGLHKAYANKHPGEVQCVANHGVLKRKSSLMIFDRHANLKYKYGNRHFGARGYIVDTVGRNKKAIKAYIQNQLEEDK